MGSNWIVIAAAAVTGTFVVISGLLSFISSRGEPRQAKELRALSEILKDMPPSPGRQALAKRRELIAKKYGESSTEIFSDLDRAMLLGMGLLALGVLLASIVSGNLTPTLVSLAGFAAIILSVIGVAVLLAALIAVVWRTLRLGRARWAARHSAEADRPLEE
ncbi:hypothetical protein ACTJI8_15755 [Microbacterium sp. 22303]|uniref:hypothetical protein n=1 Tax=Microbacterium sp. 22303 TaxID=3453905 RepID=UPI003F873EE7